MSRRCERESPDLEPILRRTDAAQPIRESGERMRERHAFSRYLLVPLAIHVFHVFPFVCHFLAAPRLDYRERDSSSPRVRRRGVGRKLRSSWRRSCRGTTPVPYGRYRFHVDRIVVLLAVPLLVQIGPFEPKSASQSTVALLRVPQPADILRSRSVQTSVSTNDCRNQRTFPTHSPARA